MVAELKPKVYLFQMTSQNQGVHHSGCWLNQNSRQDLIIISKLVSNLLCNYDCVVINTQYKSLKSESCNPCTNVAISNATPQGLSSSVSFRVR